MPTLATQTPAAPRFRLALLIWLAGMLGVVVIVLTVLPQLLARTPLPAPLWVISLASLAQSALLVALASWAGAALAPRLGLQAPLFEAAACGRPLWPALQPQLWPAVLAGVAAGGLLFAVGHFAPPALAAVQANFSPPLLARVLYGGITEEILLRWGVMSVLLWLAWRSLQQRRGTPRPVIAWLAIILAALLFGIGHLPAAAALIGTLDTAMVAYVVGANTVFGLLFGYLFWRHGLEAAMLAHAVAHVTNFLAQ